MSTISPDPPQVAVPAAPPAPAEPPRIIAERAVLRGIRWQTYEMLAADLEGARLRLTFDQGDLELMVVSYEHERYKVLLNHIVHVLAEELNVDYIDAGSATMRREDLARGIESDNCFYFLHFAQVQGKKEIDLRVDPPPDLGLEIDVTRSSLNRLGVYVALRIPEVWRFDGTGLFVYHLGDDGRYALASESRIFPGVPLAELPSLLGKGFDLSDLAFVRLVREWVRREVLPRWNQRNAGQ